VPFHILLEVAYEPSEKVGDQTNRDMKVSEEGLKNRVGEWALKQIKYLTSSKSIPSNKSNLKRINNKSVFPKI
jgi:hypothetical protein